MTRTPKYGLNKPEGSDYAKIQTLNENADAIDSALDGLETGKESLIKSTAEKPTPADADSLALVDSADDGKIKRVLWSRVKAVLKAWFDSIYAARTHAATHKTGGADALTPGDIGAEIAGVAAGVQTNLTTHVGDMTKHITSTERTAWNGKAAGSHTHGSLTNDGKIGTVANLPVFTGAGGALGTKTAAAARTALDVPSVAESTALLSLPLWARIATYETAGAFTWTAPNLFGDGKDYEIGVWMCGGGGAGGAMLSQDRTTSVHISAGGASGRARAFKMTVTPGHAYSLLVGAGGAAFTSATSFFKNGNPGGSTSFAGITVDGGEGGQYVDLDSEYRPYISAPAAIGAQCSVGITHPISTVDLFNNFLFTVNPFGGVLVPFPTLIATSQDYRTDFGMVGFPNECFDPFACTQRLGAGGGAICLEHGATNSYIYPPGLDPVSGLGGGAGSITNGKPAGDATAPGCGGGGLAYEASGVPQASRNGAGKAGAVYIYARRLAT